MWLCIVYCVRYMNDEIIGIVICKHIFGASNDVMNDTALDFNSTLGWWWACELWKWKATHKHFVNYLYNLPKGRLKSWNILLYLHTYMESFRNNQEYSTMMMSSFFVFAKFHSITLCCFVCSKLIVITQSKPTS